VVLYRGSLVASWQVAFPDAAAAWADYWLGACVASHRLLLGIAATFALVMSCCASSRSIGRPTLTTPNGPLASQAACLPIAHVTSDRLSIFKGASAAFAFLAKLYDKPLPANSEKDARSFICRLFAESRDQARDEKAPPCAGGAGHFQATTDGLDGTWDVVGLPGEVFVVMNNPPQRGSAYPEPTWTLRREGRFAIHEVLQPAFVCPSDTTQLCVSWSPHVQYEEEDGLPQTDTAAREFFCPDEQALPCSQHGYNSEFYVVDPISTRTVRIGPLERVDLPRFAGASPTRPLTVTASNCAAEISF
jgi:hypothetical protein